MSGEVEKRPRRILTLSFPSASSPSPPGDKRVQEKRALASHSYPIRDARQGPEEDWRAETPDAKWTAADAEISTPEAVAHVFWFNAGDREIFKHQVHRLKRLLRREGVPSNVSFAYKIFSQLLGYRDWQHCLSHSWKQPASAVDEEANASTVVARRKHQVEVLMQAGLNEASSTSLCDALAPTSRNFGFRGRTDNDHGY